MTSRSAARRRRAAQAARVEAVGPEGWYRFGHGVGGRRKLEVTLERDPVLLLVQVRRLREYLATAEAEAVVTLRQGGAAWPDIAGLLDVAPTTALRRYRHLDADE